MKTAVITLCVGARYEQLAKVTHPTIKAYADRIGAEFIVISDRALPDAVPVGYEKCRMAEIFEKHGLDRAIYLDTDLIVRPDCPSLFQFVPEGWFGAFNEGEWIESRQKSMHEAQALFGVGMKKVEVWGKRYYNTGVMVFDREHLPLFEPPAVFHNHFYEQTWLNLQLNRRLRHEYIKNLGIQFNRMSHVDDGQILDTRWENYIIHYAGTMNGGGYPLPPGHPVEALIQSDLQTWESTRVDGYHNRRKFKISVGGGLGDQLDAEPVVREIRRLYPRDHLIVASHWPEIFEDLDYKLEEVVDIRKHYNTLDICHALHTYSDPTQDAWNYMTHVMMHSTDFSSLLTTRRQLPPEKKLIQVRYRPDQKESMLEKLGVTADWLKDAVLVHPGRSWLTKTLESKTWNEVVEGLVARGRKVILIGKNDRYEGPKRGSDNIGLTPVVCPPGVIDAREKLELKESLALIDCAHAVVTNDSAPVHMAGATKCWIVGFFTAKHPDFVLPYRLNPDTGTIGQRWRVVEVNSRPPCWPCNVDAVTTRPSEVRADHCLNYEKRHACHPTAADLLAGVEMTFR